MLSKFIDYLKNEKRYADCTVTAYQTDLFQFNQYVLDNFNESLLDVKTVYIRSYMMFLSENGISNKTINRKISSLRSFYKYMIKQGELMENPVALTKAPKISKRLPTFIEEDKIESLLNSELIFDDSFSATRDKLIIELLFGTGIRLSELLKLKEENIDFYSQTIKVLGKGNKERIIPMPRSLVDLLKKYIKFKNELLFKIKNTNLVLTKEGKNAYPKLIYRIVLKHLSLITSIQKKSPHVLRHSYATSLLNRGADLNAVKELLGHSSLASTQVYTHNNIEKLKLIYKQAHPKA